MLLPDSPAAIVCNVHIVNLSTNNNDEVMVAPPQRTTGRGVRRQSGS